MRAVLVAALASVVLAGCSGPTGRAGKASTTAVPEGRSPVLLQVPDDPTLSFKIWFEVGSQDDPVGKEGLAYLVGQMLAQGSTEIRGYERILEELYPLAASYSISVDREMSVLSGRTHRDNLDSFYELFTDAYRRPAFSEADFGRLRTDLLNYLRKTLRYQSDEELGKAALYGFIFEGTRYAHPPEGTVRGLESITLDDVKAFYRRYYTRSRARLALGGGFDSALVRRFERDLAQLPEGAAREKPPLQLEPIEGRRVLLVEKEGADASISFGFPIRPLRGDRDFYALWIANSWLGEHRNSASHLFQVIRESRGMNYGDYSYIEAFPAGGRRQFPPNHVGRRRNVFEVWIRTLPNEQAHFALRAAVREVERLVDQGMTAEQFELTRSFLRKYVLHFADTTSRRLGYALDDRFYGLGDEGHLARFARMLEEITLEEVNAALRRHLRYDDMKIAIVTGDAAAMQKALELDARSPIEYPTEKPEEVLVEDEVISRFALNVAKSGVRRAPVDELFER